MADSPSTALQRESRPADREDKLLVERFARGDASAFDRIVAMHQGRVARLAYRLLGWPGDVDDVVQEVFLAALRGRRRFRGRASLSTWLTAITINKCRSHRRKRLLQLRLVAGSRAKGSQTPAAPADQQTTDRETLDRVRRAVRVLPARYREVVVLRYLEEMPVETVGEVLRISRNTVQVRLHRARGRLKELLAGLIEE